MKNFHSSRALPWLAAWLLLLGPLAGQAQDILVGPSRTYKTLRDAHAAGAVVSGTTVRIDDGTYSDVTILQDLTNVTITTASGRAGGVIFDNKEEGNLAGGGKSIILVRNCPGFALACASRTWGLAGKPASTSRDSARATRPDSALKPSPPPARGA